MLNFLLIVLVVVWTIIIVVTASTYYYDQHFKIVQHEKDIIFLKNKILDHEEEIATCKRMCEEALTRATNQKIQ